MKFIVKYSTEKDVIPYLCYFWKTTLPNYGDNHFDVGKKYLPIEFIEKLQKAKTREVAKEIVLNYWEKTRNKHFTEDNNLFIKWYEKILNQEKDLIIKPLENAYSEKFPFNEIDVYLTTFFACFTYFDENWYMIYRNSNIATLLDVSIHELNHFMFYYYWKDYLVKQKISKEKIEFLKESFVVLTSSSPNTNSDKPNVLTLQNFVKSNKDKPIKEIIDLVIKEGLLK